MSRNYLLLLMFLAGSLGILNSCGDIPDESPNSVKVSLGVSDHAHRSRNLGRWPFRSNAALELSSTDQGVAYLFQTSAFDLTQENVSDPRELAYSYGDYTRTSGLSGSAELAAPIGEEVFVAVGFSDAQGQGIGHFFTQPFTVSSSQTSITTQIDQVFLDNTTSGGDNSTTDNTTSNPPPSGSPPTGVFYTYDDGIGLNVATWDNQSANSIKICIHRKPWITPASPLERRVVQVIRLCSMTTRQISASRCRWRLPGTPWTTQATGCTSTTPQPLLFRLGRIMRSSSPAVSCMTTGARFSPAARRSPSALSSNLMRLGLRQKASPFQDHRLQWSVWEGTAGIATL